MNKKTELLKNHNDALTGLIAAVELLGVTVEYSGVSSKVSVGRAFPPSLFIFSPTLEAAYKVHLAIIQAELPWKITAFFPNKQVRLDCAERKPGQLRFVLEPFLISAGITQRIRELQSPYIYLTEMNALIASLSLVNKPDWEPGERLNGLGFVM